MSLGTSDRLIRFLVAGTCGVITAFLPICQSYAHDCEKPLSAESSPVQRPIQVGTRALEMVDFGLLQLAPVADNLLTVFDQLSSGVEPDISNPSHQALFSAYIQTRFSNSNRVDVNELVKKDLPAIQQKSSKPLMSRARVTRTVKRFPLDEEIKNWSRGLLRQAGQARSNHFEIESNLGFWVDLLDLPKLQTDQPLNETESAAYRAQLIAKLDLYFSPQQRELIRNTQSPILERIKILYEVLRLQSAVPEIDQKRKGRLHAEILTLISLVGFSDVQIVSKLRSDDGLERTQAIQDLVARRDNLAIELGFSGHSQEVFAKYPTEESVFLPSNEQVDSMIGPILRKLKSADREVKYTSTFLVRQLSLTESPLRSCLADSDCSTDSYLGFAAHPAMIYFTMVDPRGVASGHATIALGTAGTTPVAFLDKIQGVDFDIASAFIESIRRIVAESGYTLALDVSDLGHNGLSNNTALSRHILRVINLRKRSLGRFKFSATGNFNHGYSRVKFGLPMFAVQPAKDDDLAIEMLQPQRPRILNLELSADQLLQKTLALQNGSDEDQLRFLSISRTLLATKTLMPCEFAKFIEKVFRTSQNLSVKYQALYQWLRVADHRELNGTLDVLAFLNPSDLKQLSSQILQRKDSATLSPSVRVSLLRYRGKALNEYINTLSAAERFFLLDFFRKRSGATTEVSALQNSFGDQVPRDGRNLLMSTMPYREWTERFLKAKNIGVGRKIEFGLWYFIAGDMYKWGGAREVVNLLPLRQSEAFARALSSASKDFDRNLNRPYQSGCFAAGTLLQTPNGQRPIEGLEVGDSVTSWDHDGEKLRAKKVTEVFVHPQRRVLKLTFADGRQAIATPEHPFYLPDERGYVRAGQLNVGDLLQDADGGVMEVTDIRSLPGLHTVYNVEIEDDHNYFAEGVLVHNPVKD